MFAKSFTMKASLITGILFLAGLILLLAGTRVQAEDTAVTTETAVSVTTDTAVTTTDTEVSVATETEVDPVAELTTALEQVQEASSELEQAEMTGDTEAIEQARQRQSEAQKTMEQNLANIAGVEPEDIAAMREAGLGWGQIAQELGLHPGLLGLGHQKNEPVQVQARVRNKGEETHLQVRERTREMLREHMEATSRDLKGDFNKHALSAVDSKSQGIGLGSSKTGSRASHSAGGTGHGLGSSHGSGHGGGHGGGSSGGGSGGGGGHGGGGHR